MILLLTFAAIVVVGQLVNVAIALTVEQFSESASVLVFLSLFAVVMIGAWLLAIRLTDRLFGGAQDARGR
jgi:hypothetical protein